VFRLIFQSLVTSTGVDLGERGDRSPKFGVEGTLMHGDVLPKFLLVTCISHKSEVYTIKIVHSRVLDILRHSGSDRQSLRWIDW